MKQMITKASLEIATSLRNCLRETRYENSEVAILTEFLLNSSVMKQMITKA